MIRLAALLLVTVSLSAGVVVGPEHPVAPPAYGTAYGGQYVETIVSDGRDFLAVWNDRTPGRAGIYASPVSERLDARSESPRPIARGELQAVHAVWTGSGYLVVWYDQGKIVLARLDRKGELRSDPVVLATNNVVPAAMAWNGRHALIVTVGPSSTPATAILIDETGRMARDDIAIPNRRSFSAVSAAAAGGVFFVAWSELTGSRGSVQLVRISDDGTVAAPQTVARDVPGHVGTVSLAQGIDRVGLAYLYYYDGSSVLAMHTVEASGGAVSAAVEARVKTNTAQAVRTSNEFAAGYLTGEAQLELVMVSFSGSELGRTPVAPAPGADLRLASNGRTVVAIWRDYRLSPPGERSNMQIYGIALDGTALAATSGVEPIALSAVAQAGPVIAPAGDQALVVWKDLTQTNHGDVVAVRIDAAGNRLGAPVVLAPLGALRWSTVTAVFTGRVWIVAWDAPRVIGTNSQRTYVMMTRIAPDGTLLDREPVEVAAASVPTLASNGEVTVLALAVGAGPAVMRFTPDGRPIDAAPILTGAGGLPMSIATNGREFLLAWTSGSDWWQFPAPNRRDVQAIRLAATGLPMDSVPFDVATSANDEALPRVASDGTDFLVVYHHGQTDDGSETLRAKRVLRSGALDGTTAVQSGSVIASGIPPSDVTRLPSGFAVAYSTTSHDLWLVTLDAAGRPAGKPVQIVSSEAPVSVALGSKGTAVWLAYARTEPSLENVPRVFVRRLFDSARRRAVR